MFVPPILTSALAFALACGTLAGTPLPASAADLAGEPLVIRPRLVQRPEVVVANRYAGLVAFVVPRACHTAGGLTYSDQFVFGARKGRVWVDEVSSCPVLRY